MEMSRIVLRPRGGHFGFQEFELAPRLNGDAPRREIFTELCKEAAEASLPQVLPAPVKFRCMYGRLAVASAALLFLVHGVVAQTISRAFVGEDGRVNVVYANRAAKTIPPEKQQVGCENISVAEDKRTIGWSVLVENCCTSYPIPTAVVVYRNGKKTVISTALMTFDWRFVDRGDRVAVLFGPVHGGAAGANLYDARSGKVSASWDGKGAVPKWAQGWEVRFEHRR